MKITQPKKSEFQIQTEDITLKLNSNKIVVKKEKDPSVELSGPGEYEVNGIWIFGYGIEQPNYLIRTQGIEVGFFPSFEEKLSEENIEEFGDINIAIVEPENDDALQELIAQLQPQVAIVYGTLAKSVEDAKQEKKLSVKSPASLPQETQLYLLS